MTDHTADCLFCRILAGDLPADIVAEDDDTIAFRDINPVADTHVLVVPRRHVATLHDLDRDDDDLLGAMHAMARRVADQEGVADGYGVAINVGADGGQAVFHLHFHVVGGSLTAAMARQRGGL
jgi:histidine triad (HIT) family protein